jgi:hypothetical protein
MFLNTVGPRARTKLQLLTLAVSLGVSGIASAHPGDMAKSFGSGGAVGIGAPDLAIEPGERIVVDHSSRVVFSYTTSGSHIRGSMLPARWIPRSVPWAISYPATAWLT